jgi:erythromycin esterase-like protein
MKLSIHVLLVLLFGVAPSAKAFVPLEFGDGAALTAVTRDLCQRPVVMIGESATHGDGATEAFKVALVEKLVNECGFDSVYFEASHYEFINIARKLRESKAVSVEDVSAAIGGLWKFDEEFQPLVPFLLEKAVAGKISLGGIDDQLGEMGQDWANVAMVANLTMVLPESQGKECGLALHRRIYGEDADSSADRAEVTGCLSDARRIYAGDKANDRRDDDDWVEMIGAFQRWIDRDPAAEAEQIVARDRSMFQNFEWLRRQEPRRHKVIVWAATVHIAKQGDPTWGDRTGTNFGSLVHREYGAKAFSLGFSALMARCAISRWLPRIRWKRRHFEKAERLLCMWGQRSLRRWERFSEQCFNIPTKCCHGATTLMEWWCFGGSIRRRARGEDDLNLPLPSSQR